MHVSRQNSATPHAAVPPTRQIEASYVGYCIYVFYFFEVYRQALVEMEAEGEGQRVCLLAASLVGGVGCLHRWSVLSDFLFCLTLWADKHHYSVCWSWQRPHQCKHPPPPSTHTHTHTHAPRKVSSISCMCLSHRQELFQGSRLWGICRALETCST